MTTVSIYYVYYDLVTYGYLLYWLRMIYPIQWTAYLLIEPILIKRDDLWKFKS
jgi:hypothetical protein